MIRIKKQIRILLTGGGTGGHMYPLLAVADYLRKIGESSVEIAYAGSNKGFEREFEDRYLRTYPIMSSKLRRYADIGNVFDVPKFFISVIQALAALWSYMPDAVFSKGGPGALPVVLAARFYRIPVMIHESDAVPGLTNRLSSKYASKIAITFKEAARFFPHRNLILSGIPLRKELMENWVERGGAVRYFGFDENLPTLLVLGGSQGAQAINNFVIDNLLDLIQEIQLIHQTGPANINEIGKQTELILRNVPDDLKKRYAPKPYLSAQDMRVALSAADIVLSRAGASALSEIALFGKPAILIPLRNAANDHQRANAYAYAQSGAARIVEENNLGPHLLVNETKKILGNPQAIAAMQEAARKFVDKNATETVAKELLALTGIVL